MFTYHNFPVTPVASSGMATLPFNVLLAIPPYIAASDDVPVYNLVGDMNLFLGEEVEWERKIKVIEPRIWAPKWSDARLKRFIAPRFTEKGQSFPPGLVKTLRVKDFPGGGFSRKPEPGAAATVYEIVHFIGYVTLQNGEPLLQIGGDRRRRDSMLRPGALRDALVDAGTRLFVLQVPPAQHAAATLLAEMIAGGGGGAVLVVTGEPFFGMYLSEKSQWFESGNSAKRQIIDEYFGDFYPNVVHNSPLPAAAQHARHASDPSALTVSLFCPEQAAGMLQVDQWISSLTERLEETRRAIHRQHQSMIDLRQKMSGYLHPSQINAIESLSNVAQSRIESFNGAVEKDLDKLENVRGSIRYHESGGALPLTEVAESVPDLEKRGAGMKNTEFASAPVSELLSVSDSFVPDFIRSAAAAGSVPAIIESLKNEIEQAPRVLNANFEDPTADDKMLDPRKALAAGQECVFLVDVGPVWDTARSIVKGKAEFPIYALPPASDGWDVEVAFVSDDFRPKTVTGKIFVPAKSGRSFPYVATSDRRAETSGPLALRLTAPSLSDKKNTTTAHGRLCFYYENNLLQSAVVSVGVARAPEKSELAKENSVKVDFRLTGGFQAIDKFARRDVQFNHNGDDKPVKGRRSNSGGGQPIRLNLTVNNDGAGGHRILIKKDGSKPGIAPYNPVAANDLLSQARRTLKECFNLRNDKGKALYAPASAGSGGVEQPVIGLNDKNGKDRRQFKLDLYHLAVLGQQLYNAVFNKVEPEDDATGKRDWRKEIQKTLETPSIIQVARTQGVPVEYVFPWALIYQHLLPVDTQEFKFCRVIDEEWSEEGVRQKNLSASVCPHNKTAGDHDNLLCPYGFWGLRHIIEQPLTSLRKKDGEYLQPTDAPEEILVGAKPINLAVGVTRDTALPAAKISSHLSNLKKTARLKIIPPGEADTRLTLLDVLPASQMVYFLCHGEYDSNRREPYIGIGLRDGDFKHRVYPQDLSTWSYATQPPNLLDWEKQRPLVFINGCHTCNLEPSQILNFVSTLVDIQAGGIIGTEVSVLLGLAAEAAELILTRLTEQKPGAAGGGGGGGDAVFFSVGEAVQWMRWKLVNKGSLLGLAYTPYCLSSLRFAIGN